MTTNTLPNSLEREYRADIDGLRGIAVLSVLIFHLGVTKVSGGFVGVDIFFVITGYLFGKFALTPIHDGRFQLHDYYNRRARRLFPAFLVTMGLTSMVAFILLMPSDLVNFWKSLQSAFLFMSNIYFASASGYFDASSTSKPILHVWSLSTESQFYFLFPLITVLIRNSKKSLTALWGIGFFSFITSAVLMHWSPESAYYELPSRAWEILLGAYIWHISTSTDKIKCITPANSQMIGVCGFIMIGIALFTFNNKTPFPGYAALLPCFGAAALLIAGTKRNMPVAKTLSQKPLVYLGKISYSLYLIHWPIIVFTLYVLDRPLNYVESAAIFFFTIIVAELMHRYIETPFRKEKCRDRNYFFLRWVYAFLSIAILFSSLCLGRGYDFRIPEQAYIYSQARNDWSQEQATCPDNIPEKVKNNQLCKVGSDNQDVPEILLWGDSHATAILPAVQITAEKLGLTVIVATTNGCPPVIDVENEKRNCLATNEAILNLIQTRTFNAILLAANWGSYNHDNAIKLTGGGGDFSARIAKTIDEISTKSDKLILVDQVPRYIVDVPNYLAKEKALSWLKGHSNISKRPPPISDEEYLNTAILSVKAENISHVKPRDILCPEQRCQIDKNGISLYKDGSHLSQKGSAILIPALEKVL